MVTSIVFLYQAASLLQRNFIDISDDLELLPILSNI